MRFVKDCIDLLEGSTCRVKAYDGVEPVFDDVRLVAHAGLGPVMGLAEAAGLGELVGARVTAGPGVVVKTRALVAGMLAGADSIDDMDLLRSGGTAALIGAVRAPSTLGTWLRSFTHGHALQLQAVSCGLLVGLDGRVGGLLKPAPKDTDEAGLALVDVDDTIRQVHGYRKQAAAYGYNKVKGLNVIIVTASTPASAPVVVGAGLRRGSVRSGQSAAWYLARSMPVVRALAPDGARVLVRADCAFAAHELISTVIGMGGLFSVTVPQWPTVKNAIASIKDEDWAPIRYPRAVWDEACGAWVSDAQVAETRFTAFTSRPEAEQIPCRLVVRRVKDQHQATSNDEAGAQGELFPVWRYHAFITNTDLPAVQADRVHRRHAIIEQVIAELKDGPLAHLPSGVFSANEAWLQLAVIAFNTSRAAAVAANMPLARMRTLRTRIIAVPARLAHHARRTIVHLPARWPWARAWLRLWQAVHDPPESRAA